MTGPELAILQFLSRFPHSHMHATSIGEVLTERKGKAAKGWAKAKLEILLSKGLVEKDGRGYYGITGEGMREVWGDSQNG